MPSDATRGAGPEGDAQTLRALGLPGPLERVFLAWLAAAAAAGTAAAPQGARAPAVPAARGELDLALRQANAALPPAQAGTPAPGGPWALTADDGPPGAPGWSLWQGAGAGARLWLCGDGAGTLTVAARWHGPALAGARVRLPDRGWLELRPRAATHPLWGVCDRIAAPGGTARHEEGHPEAARHEAPDRMASPDGALLPAQDYLALTSLPPLDRPLALPPGGGAAVLNFLARLMAGRPAARAATSAPGAAAASLNEARPVRYRGPYPTGHVFDALSRSFAWHAAPAAGAPPTPAALALERARLRARFSAAEWPAALNAAPEHWVEPDVLWRPDPFAGYAPHPELWVHWRRGVEAAWIRGRVYEAPALGAPRSGGCRVWPEGDGWAAGVLLLGQPWRPLARFDAAGRLAAYDPPPLTVPLPASPAEPPWPEVLLDWAVAGVTPALAGAVAALGGELRVSWAPLPASVAEGASDRAELLIHAGAGEQFRRLVAAGGAPPGLALMAVSDVLAAALPLLRGWAQRRLLAEPGRFDPARAAQQGLAAQAEAEARLGRTLPALVAALAQGEGWR